MAVFHAQSPFMARLNALCEKVSLSDEKFEALSQQAEKELAENRALYMSKVIALALVGYAFIFAVVAVLLAMLYWMVNFLIHAHIHGGSYKVLILVLVPLWVIAKSLWLKMPEPTGIPVTRKDSPELFALIDELSKKLHTRVDKVMLDDDYNASVVQIPRLGVLGFHKNILMLGLPLMLSQRPLPFKAILAHELGHLSGNHSKSSAWIYNLRRRWGQLLNTIGEAGGHFFALFLLFFSWFSPRFSAYSLALARAHELEADAEAVKIAGADNFSHSMLALPIYAKFYYKDFWPSVHEEVKNAPTPPEAVFTRLLQSTASFKSESASLEETIREALEEKGSGTDTHPPLKVRLLHGHFEPFIKLTGQNTVSADVLAEVGRPIATQESAAQKYLGDAVLQSTLATIAEDWRKQREEAWQLGYDRLQEMKQTLLKLEETATEKPLSLEDLRLRAYLIGETEDDKACLQAYLQILEKHPEDTGAHFSAGMLLLKEDFDSGFHHLKQAIKGSSNVIAKAAPTLMPMLKARGRLAEADELEIQLKEYFRVAEMARKERISVTGESLLEPHGLDQDEIEYLQEVFGSLPTIKEAYAVRKFVKYLPDCPYLVIALEIKPQSKGSDASLEIAELARALVENLQLRYEFCISTFDMGTSKLKKNILAVEDSLIYRQE